MPAQLVHLRWPDHAADVCYSPSRAIGEHLPVGRYPLAEFLARSRAGLLAASERVRLRYGTPCARALAELSRIEAQARHYADRPDAIVIVERIDA